VAKSKVITDEPNELDDVNESASEAKSGRASDRTRTRERARERAVTRKSARSDNPLIRYFQETAVELRKVTWPSRETTLRLTLIVLGTTAVFAVFLGGLDLLFARLAALLVTS
jgi:preprotein translocase subunit SecE